ncbi:hypothetical protein A1O3_01844 [Capronia epimyces CBS 606.96]|uniref:Major facilitator superfamily (MFS) profile domain-containing protein n=1 Tax=Capronia epimyces CBS 606.96 TaxID=1182542 RepID=W9YGH2_9EURO|nr:uncharacterized protein A1O3_01844 [Capronia epimyces CBS 606.96]EXJ88780.1 hypothetical protein A1O3_01844 [Capronia epimyces CBS 606.96]
MASTESNKTSDLDNNVNRDPEKDPQNDRPHGLPAIPSDPHPSLLPSISYWRLLFDQSVVWPELLTTEYEGSGTEEDPYLVHWVHDDPRNPLNFSGGFKWYLTLTVAIVTLVAAFISSSYSACLEQITKEFGVSEEVAVIGLALYVLGFGVGPCAWAPAGELYGRQVVLFATYGALTVFNAAAAGAPNIQSLLVFRFLAGTFAASPLTNSGGVVADLFRQEQRGLAMILFAMAPFMGPVLGPIVGGFLGQGPGWRWVEGCSAIMSGVMWIISALTVPETYAPLLLRKRADKLSKMTGKCYRSKIEVFRGGRTSARHEFSKALVRPWALLFHEPIVLFLSVYMSIVYGTLYMLFGAFPIVYQELRGWNEGEGGLAFSGVIIGTVLAIFYGALDNKRYIQKSRALAASSSSRTSLPPEERLIPSIIGGISVPVSLFWFAWTNGPTVHWMASIAAGVPFGFGIVLIFISIKNYLVDAYTVFAASALAVTVIMRSCFGAAFPLFTTYMYHGLGVHWASTLVAFLSLACLPIPFVFWKVGASLRKRCRYAAEAEAMLKQLN